MPWSYVDGYAEKFEKAGMKVTKRAFDGQDHFLFFRRQNDILDEVRRWLEAH